MDDRGSIPGRGRDFSLRHRVQTVLRAYPASYQEATMGLLLRVKLPVRVADYSPPFRGGFNNVWRYTSL